MATSETPKRTPAAAPSMIPWWWSGAPRRGAVISSAPIASMPTSKEIMPASGVGRVRAGLGGQRDHEQDEAGGGHRDADPLAAADLEAEHPLGHHREHHDAGGEHGLDDGERGEGRAATWQQPGAERDAHADREPARRNSDAPAAADGGCRPGRRVRAPVLVEEAQLRCDGAGERDQDSQIESHVVPTCSETPVEAPAPIGRAPHVIGTQAPLLESGAKRCSLTCPGT